MKQAVLIYNPNSGRKTKKKLRKLEDLPKIEALFNEYDYNVTFYKTKYAGHAKKIVAELENIDLVISVGGDGTYNEVVSGNLKRETKIVLAHVPYGTTNDIGTMFGLGKNIYKNLKLLLSGERRHVDICLVNGNPFVYVAGFGKFINIPYETPREWKKKLGHSAYLIRGIKDFFTGRTHPYEIEYEVNGETYHGFISLALISNATRIAGINNFYKEEDVKLDDKQFEVLFCTFRKKQELLRSLIYLRMNNVTKGPGFYFYRTNNIKIKFLGKLKNPWCLDGEKLEESPEEYEIKVCSDLEMLVPKKVINKLFVGEE